MSSLKFTENHYHDQYAVMIRDLLNVLEFTPNTGSKDELEGIFQSLKAISAPNECSYIVKSLKGRVMALQALKDEWECWVDEKNKEPFFKLITCGDPSSSLSPLRRIIHIATIIFGLLIDPMPDRILRYSIMVISSIYISSIISLVLSNIRIKEAEDLSTICTSTDGHIDGLSMLEEEQKQNQKARESSLWKRITYTANGDYRLSFLTSLPLSVRISKIVSVLNERSDVTRHRL